MSQQIIDTVTTNDTLQAGMNKVNANFLEVYSGVNGFYSAQAITAAGTGTPTISGARHLHYVTITGASAGSGAVLFLSVGGRTTGHSFELPVDFAADASRLRVYNVAATGTLLLDQTNDSVARKFSSKFVFTGSSWRLTYGAYYA